MNPENNILYNINEDSSTSLRSKSNILDVLVLALQFNNDTFKIFTYLFYVYEYSINFMSEEGIRSHHRWL